MSNPSLHSLLDPNRNTEEEIHLTREVISAYGLDQWAERFSLMTAGYRDHIDVNDPWNPHVPFNIITVAIMAEAKGRVLGRRVVTGGPGDVHVGGEVRVHTKTFIQIAARIYAAQGYRVHLRGAGQTCPIWYSSFGVFYEGYQSGDNFTASHSPYFKLGWKVLDSEGKELTAEEEEIICEIRRLVAERSTIRLAPWHGNDRILFDFDFDEAYANYQRSVLGPELFTTITNGTQVGFRCAASPVGGSMGATSKRIFVCLNISPDAVDYFLDSEDSRFHRVGEIGDHNFGADIGKSEVCSNTGAAVKLLSGQAHVVLLWDPDGDRFNIMTTAPSGFRQQAMNFGLKIGQSDDRNMVVYLTPNQMYLLLTDYRIRQLRTQGLLNKYDWFIGTTFPTSMAIEELGLQEGLPTIRVPVGFRNLGELCRTIEEKMGTEQAVTTLTGQRIHLGPVPRALLLCEESGGATLGGPDLIRARTGGRALLALREKDGMQIALLGWAMAASLHQSSVSVAEQYCNIISDRKIQYRHSARIDVPLYDESLTGVELNDAKVIGIQRRDAVVAFFRRTLTALNTGKRSESSVRDELGEANRAASGALSIIKLAAWIGDGSLFEMEEARLIVRASGTDALIRYYVETVSRERLDILRQFVVGVGL